MEEINIDDFAKLDIRVVTILEAQEIEESEKLLKLTVEISEGETRTIFSGIKKWYKPEDLVGKKTIALVNLAPRKMMGEESQGMILAIDSSSLDKPVLLFPAEDVNSGDLVR